MKPIGPDITATAEHVDVGFHEDGLLQPRAQGWGTPEAKYVFWELERDRFVCRGFPYPYDTAADKTLHAGMPEPTPCACCRPPGRRIGRSRCEIPGKTELQDYPSPPRSRINPS